MIQFWNWLGNNIGNLFVSLIGGLIASIAAIFIWERHKQPKLIIELSTEGPAIQTLSGGGKKAFYKLFVKNIGKSPAYACKIFMRFFDETGTTQIISGVINGKWDRGPEPLINTPYPGIGINGQSVIIPFPQQFLVPFSEVLDIHNDVGAEGFCPFIKYDNETEYYAFSAWSYIIGQPPGHVVPKWKINSELTILEIELVYSGKKSQKQRFLIENKSKSADGIIIKEIKDKKKSWSNAYTWLSAILATIFTAGAIFTGIKFGFNLGLFTIWLVVMLFISFEWLIHTLSTKDMFRVVVYLLITLAIILFAASIEKVSFLDAIRTYIGKYVNFDYFIGALGIYGLAISIAAIYEDYKDRKKI